MNDSFSRISSTSPTANNGSRGGQLVQIIKLPDSLKNNAKALRLDGQITQLNSNGSVKIATPNGEIEVRVKGNRQPQVGQRVDIDIPAGRPPQQASMRDSVIIRRDAPQNIGGNNTASSNAGEPRAPIQTNIPSAAQPVRTVITDPHIVSPVPPNTPQQAQGGTQTGTQTPQNVSQPQPLPPALQEALNTPPNANNVAQQSRPLTPESAVRLLSVPPAQASTIAGDYLLTQGPAQNNLLTRVNLAANITVQNTLNQQPQILLKSLVPPISPIKNLLVQNLSLQNLFPQNLALPTPIQNSAITLLNVNFSQNNITPPLQFLAPVNQANSLLASQNGMTPLLSTSPTISVSQTLPPSAANILIGQATPQTGIGTDVGTVTAKGTLTPVAFNPANPDILVNNRVEKIDVQIIKIIPPNVAITVPNNSNTIESVTPPVPATMAFTPPLIGANNAVTLTAQVTGFTANNLPLVTVQFPNTTLPQSFVLQQNTSNLVLGTQLQIIPKIPTASLTPLPTLSSMGTANPLLQGFQWPALNDLYTSLQNLSPQAAASLSRTLPNAGNPAQIVPAAMMFLAAVKSGDIAGWLGQNKADMLERIGKTDILSRLTQGGTTRTAAAEPASAGEWRAVPLPMFWEGEIHRITLYTKYDGGAQEQQKQQKGSHTRFIFDLSLSRMGEVQLDGLLRDKRLDLVIRSQNTFSATMQQEMRQAYSGALDQTDLTGELTFQGSTKNWVNVIQGKTQLGVHV